MDSYMRRQLDSYIMGEHIHYDGKVLHRCPQCKRESMVRMVYEMGGWFYPGNEEDEAYCFKCDKEMEIIE